MKIFLAVTILAVLFLAACGSENPEADITVHPVDVWSPFVQAVPPGNIWEPPHDEAQFAAPMQLTARQERMTCEINRLFSFFVPDRMMTGQAQTLPGRTQRFHYPDYFGGVAWQDDYWIVFIVEGMEDEASEFLAYLDNFVTVQIQFTPHNREELVLE